VSRRPEGRQTWRPCRAAGWDDRAILDLTHVVAYVNDVNRIASGLGVRLKADLSSGRVWGVHRSACRGHQECQRQHGDEHQQDGESGQTIKVGVLRGEAAQAGAGQLA